jgi:YgiT-type zinc finger domain-containing protein
MKCVICKSSDIQKRPVEEEVKQANDIVLIPMEVMVCQQCGERYYDTQAMRKLEEMRSKLLKKDLVVEDVGRVLRAKVA